MRDEDVCWLYVAVDYAPFVQMADCFQELLEDVSYLLDPAAGGTFVRRRPGSLGVEKLSLDLQLKSGALQVFHQVIDIIFIHQTAECLHKIWMIYVLRYLSLPDQPIQQQILRRIISHTHISILRNLQLLMIRRSHLTARVDHTFLETEYKFGNLLPHEIYAVASVVG